MRITKKLLGKKNDQKIGRNDQDEIQRHKVSKCHWKSDAKDLLHAGLAANLPLGVGVGREAVSGKESKVKGNKMRCTAHRNMSLRLINIFISSHSCLFVFCGESARNLSKFQYAIKSFISFYF